MFKKPFIFATLLFLLHPLVSWGAPQHGIAMHGDLKYKPGEAFSYVNPKAPKGGTLRLSAIGTFDSTNPYLTKGIAPGGVSLFSEPLVFESLLKRAKDEPFSLYGLIAESLEVALDRSWIIFHLNPKATWADGRPITVEDVIFSHKILRDKGRPNLRLFYSRVQKVEKLGNRSVKFTFKPLEDGRGYDPELPLLIGLAHVLPKHFFEGRDFEKVSLKPLMGSGPYRLESLKPGHGVTYVRRSDYWGWGLPVNAGQHNFDRIKFEYYRDTKVALEAFKAGQYDFRGEPNPRNWYTSYDFPGVREGRVTKIEVPHRRPVVVFAMIMNTRRALFRDPEVRRALSYAFDFEWLNKNLYYGALKRMQSYFDNTELACGGLPEGGELALLEPFRDQLPREVFTTAYKPPQTDGSGNVRQNLRVARRMLAKAGWRIQDGRLIHEKTKQPFVFEILLYRPETEKLALAFARNLKQLGIQVKIHTADAAQFENRRLQFDFDMVIQDSWGGTRSPGRERTFYFHSDFAEESGSRNYPGIKDPVVDHLCEVIATAKNRKKLVDAAKALDRVLLWGHYVIPLFYKNRSYMAYYKDRIDHPPFNPQVSPLFSTWWSKDAER